MVSNALKFSYTGGSIHLKSVEQIIDDQKYLLLLVEDQGTGMEADKLGQLFKSVYAKSMPGTKNETGTGLGLILCKEFIEKQGGFITVESLEGKGTTFTVGFPLG